MTSNFTPTAPYHRFYLSNSYGVVQIVHTTYKVTKLTACGVWIEEASFSEKHWVSNKARKAFAYQDIVLAWKSFNIRMKHRLNYVKRELCAVEAAIKEVEKSITLPVQKYTHVITLNEEERSIYYD